MPLYDVECSGCKRRDTLFRKIAEMDNLPECSCGGTVYRCISAPMLASVNIEPFISPGTGKVIDSKTAYKEDLKRSGAIPWEPGLKEQVARNRLHEQEKAFAPISHAVDEAIRARLANDTLET